MAHEKNPLEIMCWRCKQTGYIDLEDIEDEDDMIDLVGVCPLCLTPGVTEYICDDGHIHTMPLRTDPTNLNGLKEIQFVFDTIEKLIPDSILSTEGKEKVRRAVEVEKATLKLKIQQVEN